ncbi:MAG: Hydrogenase-4 component E [candidate division BRC1 bacterium ADurb.BinA364]|nr:MAG: Hydrogenase-4 component E [candidate division BRC1 bacterium ADurb.BinA364]
MRAWLDIVCVLLALANLRLLGSSQLISCIRTAALQAWLMGAAALLANATDLSIRLLAIVLFGTALKAVALPWMLRRAARESAARREVEPFIGYSASLLIGVALLGACFLIGSPLHEMDVVESNLFIPMALFTIATGLAIIVSRRKAVTQVVGYLAMENGIYVFGAAFAIREPLLVEMGVLLDVFVAVFVMGIMIHHIGREFDHIDTDRLSVLKD